MLVSPTQALRIEFYSSVLTLLFDKKACFPFVLGAKMVNNCSYYLDFLLQIGNNKGMKERRNKKGEKGRKEGKLG